MNTKTFTVPGPPAPWQVFTRYSQAEGKNRLKAYQDTIWAHLRRDWPYEPLPGPVALDVEFWLPLPERAPKGEAALERWKQKHIAMKPDRTNLLKGAEDACQGILFVNDSQVTEGRASKQFVKKHSALGFTRITLRW